MCDKIIFEFVRKFFDGGDFNVSNINNANNFASITGTDGVDNIYNSGSYAVITTGDGNDSIDNVDAPHAAIRSGSGDDTIYNKSTAYVTIDASDGNDIITSYSSRSVINAGAGNDYINTSNGSHVTINGGDGSDTIIAVNQRASINGGDGDDVIHTSGLGTTILGGKGNDTFTGNIYAEHYVYSNGDGNDVITNYEANDAIQIMSGKITSSSLNGSDFIINIGSGSITLIDALDTVVKIMDKNLNITHLNPHDYVNTNIDEATITGTDIGDYIENGDNQNGLNTGSNVTINAGGGDDTLNNKGDNVYIDAGTGDDIINNTGTGTTIIAAAGNDSIKNDANFVLVNSGDGNDYVYSYLKSEYVTINGGSGNDSLRGYGKYGVINGNDGNDYIFNGSNAHYSTLTGGDGSDTIRNSSAYRVLITGGDGNDSIFSNGDNVTIEAGAGDDTIKCGTGSSFILYGENDGNDIIYGYKPADTINLTSGSIIRSELDGADVILYISDNKILTIKNAKNRLITIADADGSVTSRHYELTLPEGIISDSNRTALTVGSPFEGTLDLNYYPKVKDVDASQSDCSVFVIGNEKANVFRAGSGGGTLEGALGNDVLYCGEGNDVLIYSKGDGSDTIYKYQSGQDSIQLNSDVTVSRVAVSGRNVIMYFDGGGSIKISEAKNKELTITDSSGTTGTYKFNKSTNGLINDTVDAGTSDRDSLYNYNSNSVVNGTSINEYIYNASKADNSTINSGAGNDSIKNAGADNVLINAGSGNDSIYTNGDNVTINAGLGDDTIRLISSSNLIQYNSGDGNDVIYGSTDKDTIHLISGEILGSTIDGSDVMLKIDDDILTLKSAYKKNLTIIDAEGNVDSLNSSIRFPDGVVANTNYTAITVSSPFEGTIDLNSYRDLKTVVTSSDCSVYVIGNSKTNVLKAGSGGATLEGGIANDVLYCGDGTDALVYSKGDGNDTIYKYQSGQDIIQLSSDVTVSNVAVRGRTVYMYFEEGGSIKIDNAKGKAITIVDGNGETGTYTYTKNTNGLIDTDTTAAAANYMERNYLINEENEILKLELNDILQNNNYELVNEEYKSDDEFLKSHSTFLIPNSSLNKRGDINGK